MENNEMMNYEETKPEVDDIEIEEDSGMGIGIAMLIGAGLTVAAAAAVKFGKKAYAKIKAKKELRKPDDDDFVEVTDEDIDRVTK